MQYLQTQDYITLKEYAKVADIPISLASRTLVRLVLANVLDIRPAEVADQYIIKPQEAPKSLFY